MPPFGPIGSGWARPRSAPQNGGAERLRRVFHQPAPGHDSGPIGSTAPSIEPPPPPAICHNCHQYVDPLALLAPLDAGAGQTRPSPLASLLSLGPLAGPPCPRPRLDEPRNHPCFPPTSAGSLPPAQHRRRTHHKCQQCHHCVGRLGRLGRRPPP